jgi:uncharacterized protein
MSSDLGSSDQGVRRWPWGWWLAGLGFLGLVAIGVVVLELWEHPPAWLDGARQVVVEALSWVRVHWATSGAIGVIVALLGLWLQRRWERGREQRDQSQLKAAANAEQVRQAKAAEDARTALLAANCWVDEASGWLPRVGQVTNPVALGVHPAAEVDDLQADGRVVDLPAQVPVYVPRDKDAELEAKLARGGLVLLVGDSTAGKSRAAYEAIHRLFGQRWLLVPNNRQSLRALLDGGIELRETVVWLNDLERWLGPDGLDLGLLRRLVGDGRRQVVLVATMRASEYAARIPDQTEGYADAEQELRRVEQELLDQAARVDLPRRFSQAEQDRAELRTWDPRIADALAHVDAYGLAEYIAAGPRLWQRWRDGLAVDNPPERLAGAAIVTAAVDCRLVGLTRPVSEQVLKDLFLGYLDASVARRLGAKTFHSGLAWAATPIQATTALLQPTDGGWAAFDYVVDRVEVDGTAPPVPDAVWECVLRVADPNDLLRLGVRAREADRPQLTEEALRRAADAGHYYAAYGLGLFLLQEDRTDEAEPWFQRAAEAGFHPAEHNLGLLLAGQDRAGEAEQWLRKAAEAGYYSAERSLGLLLERRGDADEAEQWYRKAAEAGFHEAEQRLGLLLERRGDADEAEQWLRKAAEAGHHPAENNLGLLLAGQERTEEGEQWLRRAAEAGFHPAEHNLGLLLAGQDRAGEAEQWLRKAAEAGFQDAADNLRVLLERRNSAT